MSVTIRDFLTHDDLMGRLFGGESYAAWRALLCAFYGLTLTDDEAEAFKAVTGRESVPESAADELWMAIGRRGGKSQMAAAIAVFEAFFRDHTDKLAPGERGVVFVVAADRRQAKVLLRYVEGMISSNPMLEAMVVKRQAESIELTNRTDIQIGTCSVRSLRGFAISCAVLDEVAHWHMDGAKPDNEVVASIRPALSSLGGRLVALSSPYSRRGMLWNMFKRHYGKDSRIMVAKAPSRSMNPTLPEHIVTEALEEDYASASAEYLAEFRSDLEQFVSRELLEGLVREGGPAELPPDDYGKTQYTAFCDPAGSGADLFALCIGHKEGESVVIDVLRGRQGPPAAITREYCDLLKRYGIRRVVGDRYAAGWVSGEFLRHGVTYDYSVDNRTGLYLNFLAAASNGRVLLPPDEKMLSQFQQLERRTSRAGKDVVDHPPSASDDLANACAGLVSIASARKKGIDQPIKVEFAC